jgi:hypothetical protein
MMEMGESSRIFSSNKFTVIQTLKHNIEIY